LVGSDNFANFAAKFNNSFNIKNLMVKKYLIGSVAAVAAMTLTTSCSNDDVFDASQDINVAKYETMFIQKFGTPASDQTWGFGTVNTRAITRAKIDYEGIKGSMSSVYTFPEDASADKFIESVPEGVELMPADGEVKGGIYYINSSTTRVNMNSGAGVIYVQGTCDLSKDNCFEIPQNTVIYLISGSKLILGTNDANKLKAIIYIHSNATLETANRLKMDNTSKVYNHGTITAGAFEVNNSSFLYNVGKMTTTGKVYIANNNASIVNDGTLIVGGDLEVAGSGHFQNNAETSVTGNTELNSYNLTWVNNGIYDTYNFNYTSGSSDVINNCRLNVTNLFWMNLGSVWPLDREVTVNRGFRMDTGAGVVTKNLSLESCAFINMNPGSVFKVTQTATMNITNPVYGIYGPASGDYAVFQAKNITCVNPRQRFNVSYYDNLYVVSETHFTYGYDNINESEWATHEYQQNDGPFYYVGEGVHVYTNGDAPDYTIPATKCCPGFGNVIKPIIRVMAEDLTIGDASKDFDFNDVVFTVLEWTSDGVKVRLDAAGGTLPLIIGGKDLQIVNGEPVGTYYEIHEAFAEVNPDKTITTKTMINTAAGKHYQYDCPELFLSGDFTAEEGIDKAINIKLFVNKGTTEAPNWLELDAQKGKVCKKFGCDTKVDWCDERQDIEEVYGKFGRWVQGQETFFY
jgi:hypothetical protein